MIDISDLNNLEVCLYCSCVYMPSDEEIEGVYFESVCKVCKLKTIEEKKALMK